MGSWRKSQPLERCRSNVAHGYKSFNWIPRWPWVPKYMYRMFVNEDFHKDHDDLEVFWNIRKHILYLIAAKPIILPYNDVVKSIFKHINLGMRSVISEGRVSIAYLQPYSFKIMFKLKKIQVLLNKTFLDEYRAKEFNLVKKLKDWWTEYKAFLEKNNWMYSTQYLRYPYRFMKTMIFMLYGEEGSSCFKIKWNPLVHRVVDTWHDFNWVSILSVNLLCFTRAIKKV